MQMECHNNNTMDRSKSNTSSRTTVWIPVAAFAVVISGLVYVYSQWVMPKKNKGIEAPSTRTALVIPEDLPTFSPLISPVDEQQSPSMDVYPTKFEWGVAEIPIADL
jgi:hypothetical protein